MSVTAYLLEIGQVLLALAVAPGLVGVIRWSKARLQGRLGAPPWLPYYDLRKLFGKEVVVSNNASWLFRFTPYLVFASTLSVIFLIPLLAAPLPFDGVGDLLLVVYLLLLATFFLALAGLDPGTAFGGMGASREMTIAAIACSPRCGNQPRSPAGIRCPLHRHAGGDRQVADRQSFYTPGAHHASRGNDPRIFRSLPGIN